LHFLENVCANDLQKYRVCYKHFREENYSCSPHNRVLCSTAIPVIHISNNHDNDVITVNNMQHTQKPLHVSKENDDHSEMCSSMLTEISHVQKQMQHQLAEQQNLLETYHAEQTQLQNKVYKIEQKISDNDITEKNDLQQFHYEHTNHEKEKESIIHEHEKRLNKIEEQLTGISPINKLQFAIKSVYLTCPFVVVPQQYVVCMRQEYIFKDFTKNYTMPRYYTAEEYTDMLITYGMVGEKCYSRGSALRGTIPRA